MKKSNNNIENDYFTNNIPTNLWIIKPGEQSNRGSGIKVLSYNQTINSNFLKLNIIHLFI